MRYACDVREEPVTVELRKVRYDAIIGKKNGNFKVKESGTEPGRRCAVLGAYMDDKFKGKWVQSNERGYPSDERDEKEVNKGKSDQETGYTLLMNHDLNNRTVSQSSE